jgi:hypothetical protein
MEELMDGMPHLLVMRTPNCYPYRVHLTMAIYLHM